MKQANVKILANKGISGKYFKLSFTSSLIAKEAKPGQFLEVKVNEGLEPFLRKPLSVHSVKGETLEILYEVVGEGTQILSKKKSGETLDIIGPLGNGFSYQLSAVSRQPIVVAGGIGVAPLMFLAEKLVHSPQSTVHKKVLVLLGAKTKNGLLCEKEFKNLGCEVKIGTDDGSKGRHGFVTDILRSSLSTMDRGLLTIYACGPKPMLKETASIAKGHKIPCQVLLEEYMACGVGACLGCAVKVRQLASSPVNQLKPANRPTGKQANYIYKMVCKDGPVFEVGEIIWE